MNNIKIVHIADVHYGTNKLSPEWIYNNIKKYVYPQLKDCNLLVIAGDFFEMLLTMDSITVQFAIRTMMDIFELAKEHHFLIRIVRGTFFHDRTQNQIFEYLSGASEFFKYFDSISLEYIESLNLRMLYIPDNVPFVESSDCLIEIKRQMRQTGWDCVDLVVGHGYFEHVLPPGIPKKPPCVFKVEQFKDIVKGYILMGHVHTHSIHKFVIYSGSTDRLAHGEEESKGFVVIHKNDDKWRFEFVVNKDAMIFKTIKLTSESFDDCVEHIEKALKRIFKDFDYVGYIRIIHHSRDLMKCLCDYLNNKYSGLKIKGKTDERETSREVLDEDFSFTLDTEIIPTEENIAELLYAYASETNPEKTLTLLDISRLMEELK